MTKVVQTAEELRYQLQDQIRFLANRCNAFDQGETNEAKRIATTLRILFHDSKFSKSLLGQLGLKNRPYYNSAILPEEGGEQIITNIALAGRLAGNHTHSYSPHLGLPEADQFVNFNDWWSQVVITDKEGNEFTRSLIILSIADQDGGAHVDPALNEAYYKLTRLNSANDFNVLVEGEPTIEKLINAQPVAPKVSPAFYVARQIAHEFLVSLLEYHRIPQNHRTLYTFNKDFYSGVSLFTLGLY
ncbi:hypothetical protein M0L20_29595 [Spirosoma sp. RP8]|uniref:Uncharacterized protein n=1 Tax=Spirosoma liriopis TaxID=2937440 RepID=A0ABT0HW07_9BACT|nr:hypothetical protein [Spirosoma liriopis]MCK8496057.1 hypothetical protein [Spirosoma liriopis]